MKMKYIVNSKFEEMNISHFSALILFVYICSF